MSSLDNVSLRAHFVIKFLDGKTADKQVGLLLFQEPIPEMTVQRYVSNAMEKFQSQDDVHMEIYSPDNWRMIEERKGQIALAVLKLKVLKDGIKLSPNDVRSDIGNAVKELNEQNPDLNLSLEEALGLYKEFVDLASEATFRPKSRIKFGKPQAK